MSHPIKEPVVVCMVCNMHVDSRMVVRATQLWALIDEKGGRIDLPPGDVCKWCMGKLGDGRIDLRKLQDRLVKEAKEKFNESLPA